MPPRAALRSTIVDDPNHMHSQITQTEPTVEIGLSAAIVAVHDYEPVLLVVKPAPGERDMSEALPSGPFSPINHRTLEIGLRSWVAEHTHIDLGFAEQLYTFGDRGRLAQHGDTSPHIVSIGYLAISDSRSDSDIQNEEQNVWHSWYRYFPWEDWRNGPPEILSKEIVPRLQKWAANPAAAQPAQNVQNNEDRVRICFGLDAAGWDEERVLDRYELLYEAGLVEESARDGQIPSMNWGELPRLGLPMRFDHRRILAMAIGRLRAKIKYRPVIFELVDREFTLFELQKTVEAILGPQLHKQNFRRLVESSKLVESTGGVKTRTGGRPAKLFRFRREVVMERPAPGVRLKPGRH